MKRRHFIQQAACGAALFTTPGLFAEQLAATAEIGEGPFYPDKLPLDTDNDLLILNDSLTPAVGEITHLTGKIRDAQGRPLRNAFVEIWQVDANGSYLHSASSNREKYDRHFQGYGRFLTGSTGDYYFRTIKPVPYPGRTPHIHIAVSQNARRIFTSQLLIAGNPQNENDLLYRRVNAAAQKTLLAEFKPLPHSQIGELTASFDVILGRTAEDPGAEPPAGVAQPLSRARSRR